jgi:hypothetical protein
MIFVTKYDLPHVNHSNDELKPICHMLALLAHPIFHVSRIRIKSGAGKYILPLLVALGTW